MPFQVTFRKNRSKIKQSRMVLNLEQLEARRVLSSTPLVTEFMASNSSTLNDGDGNTSDWIEIHNPTAASIDLNGWHLTDDASNLSAWTFPDLPQSDLSPGEYLIVFASNQTADDYVDAGGFLHTNFKLRASGEYLGLIDPAGVVIHEFSPEYPAQQADVSYGVYPDDLAAGAFFFAVPTPGAVNSISAVPDSVAFSRTSRTFTESFQVVLSGTTNPNQTIRYTLDGTRPDASSSVYSGPIPVSATLQVRARIVQTGFADGPISTSSYSRLGADVRGFQSQLPILLIENFGAGEVPGKDWNQTGAGVHQVARQSAAITLFGNGEGVASLTGATDLQSRSGIRERGAFSSTFPEPQYSLETWSEEDDDFDVSVFGMAPESDWILYSPNPSVDETLMSNQFPFELANQMGLWAPKVQYVEAFLNTDGGDVTMADYVGLYVWTEKVKRDAGRLDFDSFAADGGSGGWLLSINRMDAIPEDDPTALPRYFHTPGANGVLETSPDSPGQGDDIPRQYNAFINFEHPNGYAVNSAQRQAIEGWFAEMEDVLFDRTAAAWNDPVEGYAKYIDVDNFIDYFIIHNLSKNSDGLLLSMWIYNPDPNNGGRLHFGPPWDHDLGSFSGSPTSSLRHRSDRLWYGRLFQDPAFVQRYQDRWQDWRQTVLSDASMNQVFDDLRQEIGEAAILRDGVTDITSRIDTVKNWLSRRAAAIDSQFLAPPQFNQAGGEVPVGFELSMTATAESIYYTTDGTDPRMPNGSINPDAILYDETSSSTSLVSTGSTWRYLDDGTDQQTAWKGPLFSDATWAEGAAQLGYGDGDEATVVSYGGDSSNKQITTYFRKSFSVEDPTLFSGVTLRLLRDDGASVFINGAEVARSNMPGTLGDGTISYQTRANSAVGGSEESTQFFTFTIDPDRLVAGNNVIAVEIHQSGPNSSDISFDLELLGQTAGDASVVLDESTTITARAKNSSDWSGTTQADFFVGVSRADSSNLRVSEINYNPHDALVQFGEMDVDHDQFEFLELVNISDTDTIDLKDSALVSGVDFSFGGFTPLAAGDRILVVRDQAAFESRYGTGLNIAGEFQNATRLSNSGEEIKLDDASGGTIAQFTYNDRGRWPGRPDGKGSSLVVVDTAGDYDSPSNWRSSVDFGGSPGLAGIGKVDDIIINEVLSHGEGTAVDKIELYNTTSSAIDLESWYLSNTNTNYMLYTFGAGAVIGAGEYLVLDQDEFGFDIDGLLGGDVWLVQGDSNADGKPIHFVDHHDLDATAAGISLGLVPNGDPTTQGASFFPMTGQTFGTGNSSYVVGDVVISEVLFDPAPVPPAEAGNIATDELEYVELYNTRTVPLDIRFWKVNLQGGTDLILPTATVISASGMLLLVGFDPVIEPIKAAAFRGVYSLGSEVLLAGPFGGNLDDSDEKVELLRPEDPSMPLTTGYVLVDRVGYGNATPWPTTTAGTGESIHRNASASFGSFASSWNGSAATPGTTTLLPIGLVGDFNGDNVVDLADFTVWRDTLGSTNDLRADGDGSGMIDDGDRIVWKSNFGKVAAPPAAQAVTVGESTEEPIYSVMDAATEKVALEMAPAIVVSAASVAATSMTEAITVMAPRLVASNTSVAVTDIALIDWVSRHIAFPGPLMEVDRPVYKPSAVIRSTLIEARVVLDFVGPLQPSHSHTESLRGGDSDNALVDRLKATTEKRALEVIFESMGESWPG